MPATVTASPTPARRTGARTALPHRAALAASVVLALWLALLAAPQAASAAPVLLSQGRPATASSSEGAGYAAPLAVDGNAGTRWASARTGNAASDDDQWVRVDLGATSAVTSVELVWEGAYAKSYRVEVSDDATTWRTLASTTTGAGGTERFTVSGSGRYVRMKGITRAGGYGYSLWEMRVYGTAGATPAPAPTPAPTPPTPTPAPSQSGVHVTGSQGAWQLSVDGRPWPVRGVTYGPPQGDAARYVPDLKAMGVNTVRTWGVDDAGTPRLLDAAAANGMKVIVGHWLDQNADYAGNTAYKNAVKADVVRRVNALKGNPGVLMWDLGNEVLLTMGGSSPADVEARRVAYARFVDELAVAVHQADPNHPVTSTDAWTGAFDYYERYSPHLDLYGINTYGGAAGVKGAWHAGGYTKPYVFTEAGAPGDWEVGRDVNGVPDEPTDVATANAYASAWSSITSDPGVGLGGTLFNYGLEDDYAGVWLNVYTGGQHRLAWYALQKAFTGSTSGNTSPVISAMDVSSRTGVRAGSTFTVSVRASDPDGDAITYAVRQGSHEIDGSGTLTAASATATGAGAFTVTAPSRPGVWRFYVYASDGHGNVGIETRSVRVTA